MKTRLWLVPLSVLSITVVAFGLCSAQDGKKQDGKTQNRNHRPQPIVSSMVIRPFSPEAYHREIEYSRLVGLGNRSLASDPRMAASYFQKALPLSEVPDEAATGLGKAMEEQGRLAEAFAAYRLAYGPAKHSYSTFPADVEALTRYGLLAAQTGQWREAVRVYKQARERLNPKPAVALDVDFNPKAPQPEQLRAMLHVVRGLTLEEQGKGNEALSAYSEAARLQPDQPLAQFYLGRGLQRAGRTAEARAAFQKAARFGNGAVQSAAQKALR